MNVLIVDDDLTNREALTGLAGGRGHEVTVCENADEAWISFERSESVLVILDWSISESDKLCRRIRTGATTRPAVLMALTDHPGDLESALACGADDYLIKPVDAELFGIRLAIAEQRVLEVRKRLDAETEMTRLNEGLARANDELRQANDKLKSNQTQLVHSEKMASLGQLAAGIAHEINNPVGFVKSNLGMLSDYVGIFKDLLQDYDALATHIRERPMNGEATILNRIDRVSQDENLDFVLKDVDSLLAESLTGAERVREIAQSLKSFARLDEAEMQYADVNEGLHATLRMIWNELKYHCTIQEDLEPLPPILCFPGQLNQVFMNLLMNASQAIEEKGEITIETRALEDEVLIRVADTGEGIPEQHLPKLFNPFFTTKPIGEGTGLGLSVSYGIIRKHCGRIEVDSELGVGTTFSIFLPISDACHE